MAIGTARWLANEHGVADRRRCATAPVEDAPTVLRTSFDVVYTSWGVLFWLPELAAWAAAIKELLVPGGFLYRAESHSYAGAVHWTDWHYEGARAHFDESRGDYTDDGAIFEHPESWGWSTGWAKLLPRLLKPGCASTSCMNTAQLLGISMTASGLCAEQTGRGKRQDRRCHCQLAGESYQLSRTYPLQSRLSPADLGIYVCRADRSDYTRVLGTGTPRSSNTRRCVGVGMARSSKVRPSPAATRMVLRVRVPR